MRRVKKQPQRKSVARVLRDVINECLSPVDVQNIRREFLLYRLGITDLRRWQDELIRRWQDKHPKPK